MNNRSIQFISALILPNLQQQVLNFSIIYYLTYMYVWLWNMGHEGITWAITGMMRWLTGAKHEERQSKDVLSRRICIEKISNNFTTIRLGWFGQVTRKIDEDWVNKVTTLEVECQWTTRKTMQVMEWSYGRQYERLYQWRMIQIRRAGLKAIHGAILNVDTAEDIH